MDILVITKTWKEYSHLLRDLFTRLNDKAITLNFCKSNFGKYEVKFLGHIVNKDGIKPDPVHVEAIAQCPSSRNRKQLKSFLGMVGFLRLLFQE